MSSYTYVDGRYCLKNTAKTYINDRGYQFGDAVYEVVLYREGTFFDLNGHLARLRNSLKSLDINSATIPKDVNVPLTAYIHAATCKN